MTRVNLLRPVAIGVIAVAAVTMIGCSGPAPQPAPATSGPAGSGVVSAPAESGALSPGQVGKDTACEIAARSATLAGMGATGSPSDVSLVVELSMCELTFPDPALTDASVAVSILTAQDVALTAEADTDVSGGSRVLLPDVGENGHFLSRIPGADPADDPANGAIVAARGDLGLSVTWATSAGAVPYATFEQAARELLDALSG